MMNDDFILSLFKKYDIAVETGTFIGGTTKYLSKYFDEVHTIELDRIIHEQACFNLKDYKNISCYCGDSETVLKTYLIDKLNAKNKKVFFFLDAHWSGDDTVDWDNSNFKGVSSRRGRNTAHRGIEGTTPSSKEQVPLEEEIMHIYNYFNQECLIVIDDWKNFDKNLKGIKNKEFIGEDWSHLDFNIILNNIKDRLADRPKIYTTKHSEHEMFGSVYPKKIFLLEFKKITN